MELIEREDFLGSLHEQFETILEGEGHCAFVSGEAGIGKTSLVKVFCQEIRHRCRIYRGTCDALFTPRPLAPIYDILLQLRKSLPETNIETIDRTALFTGLFHDLQELDDATVIVFEDIHWADEATLDFIKFLARRITQLRCLFILTYRDNEIHSRHPLRNVLGQLNSDSITRLELLPLSRYAVQKLAQEKSYDGSAIYDISGGNPFYVTEILASYSPGVPDNIKDSILAVYNRLDEKTKHIWDILSILPTGLKIQYLDILEPSYASSIEECLDAKILFLRDGVLLFKHELYRRTVESSLSPLIRIAFNKKILTLFKETFEKNQEIEQIIHHAKNANEYDLVVEYAPRAARQAATLGAHIEASRLYLSAIEYYQGTDIDTLIEFYDAYSYECYLTNQVREAIIYTGKSLALWKKKDDPEKIGNCMRFLSRFWWFDGNREKAEDFGVQAIKVLEDQPASKAKAMAFSNMSQLKMLSDQADDCAFWGEKAIAMATVLGDEETLCHALNNVGDVQIRNPATSERGIHLLQQSLEIALKNGYHEHVARAYTNLSHNAMLIKDYGFAKEMLDAGIQYCEERDLDSWTTYMLSNKARLHLETGNWKEALALGENLIKDEFQAPISKIGVLGVLGTLKVRTGQPEALAPLLEAKTIAFQTMELQRIIPALVGLLEYEWITGKTVIENEALENTIRMTARMGNVYENSGFAFWLWKGRNQRLPLEELYGGYDVGSIPKAAKAAALWKKSGCPYEEALMLFHGTDENKRKAITIMLELGAAPVCEKMKLEMRSSGIRNIPRGIRKSTQSNPALLTDRELDVLKLLNSGMQNKEIAARLFRSAKTVDHHISSILFKLEVNSRVKAVQAAIKLGILK